MRKVSVIMNCFNGEEFLRETLDSLSKQTYSNFELVFVDNCSTDDSANIVRKFGDRLKYYLTPHHMSLGEARNYALDRCTGDYIAFLDSDDLWRDDKLELQVSILEKNKGCDICVSNYYTYNMMLNSKEVFIKKRETGILDFCSFATGYNYALSSFMITKKSLARMNYHFDTRLSFAEEFDFFLRLSTTGKVYYLNEPLSTYRIHGGMTSFRLKEYIPKEYNIVANNLSDCYSELNKYPEVLNKLTYLRDYAQTKYYIESEQYLQARRTIKNHVTYNKRALFLYCLLFLPAKMVQSIYWSIFNGKL